MIGNITRTASRWLGFYMDYVSDWWDHITYSQYMVLMALGLVAGWLLLKSSVKSAH